MHGILGYTSHASLTRHVVPDTAEKLINCQLKLSNAVESLCGVQTSMSERHLNRVTHQALAHAMHATPALRYHRKIGVIKRKAQRAELLL